MTPQQKADEIRDRRRAAQQTGAWVGENETHKYVMRLYADGTMTAEVKDLATGLYAGEVVITPEAGWWDDIAPRSVKLGSAGGVS